jgi:hypothetical protein
MTIKTPDWKERKKETEKEIIHKKQKKQKQLSLLSVLLSNFGL